MHDWGTGTQGISAPRLEDASDGPINVPIDGYLDSKVRLFVTLFSR